jgi:branched-chain amino acid transport system permease protein
MARRWLLPVLLAGGLAFSIIAPRTGFNPYLQMILIMVGINVILTVSLNLVNGYMGEFSVGHAGLMGVGAYTAALLTVRVIPEASGALYFPLAVLAGGAAAALVGVPIAILSFKTRGDYLAIVTLAANLIIKSVIENINAIGGASGFLGMARLTNLFWVFFWVVASLWIIRNFIYSRYGRGVLSIREDEIAGQFMSVSTRRVKLFTFALSSFFAGVAGALYAHFILSIYPVSFGLTRSTEILIMVYLGGIGSIAGSVLGAGVYTILLEALRPIGAWRMVIMPLLLVLLMLFRPRGIMGLRELRWLVPRRDLARPAAPLPKEVADAAAAR